MNYLLNKFKHSKWKKAPLFKKNFISSFDEIRIIFV